MDFYKFQTASFSFVSVWTGAEGAGANMADSPDESEYLEESESEEMSDEARSATKRSYKGENEAVGWPPNFNLATKKRQLEIKMVAAVGVFNN